MDSKDTETGWRGSRDLWLDAAQSVLLEQGVDAVRIVPLAKRLNLSRTSFYWFFKDREALLDGLLARWRDRNTGSLEKQSNAYAETVAEAMLNIFDCWLDQSLFDAAFEFAVRSWALQSSEVAAEVERADAERLAALTALFIRFGHTPVEADVRARTVYLVQIGYITVQAQEDIATRMRRIPTYVEIFTGRLPEPRELARFHARHGYSEAA